MTALACPRCGHKYEPRTHPLTAEQHKVLTFVADYIDEFGYAPTLEEIADALGLRALATVHEHLTNLRAKGWIERRYNERRAIEVLVRPNPPPRGEV